MYQPFKKNRGRQLLEKVRVTKPWRVGLYITHEIFQSLQTLPASLVFFLLFSYLILFLSLSFFLTYKCFKSLKKRRKKKTRKKSISVRNGPPLSAALSGGGGRRCFFILSFHSLFLRWFVKRLELIVRHFPDTLPLNSCGPTCQCPFIITMKFFPPRDGIGQAGFFFFPSVAMPRLRPELIPYQLFLCDCLLLWFLIPADLI